MRHGRPHDEAYIDYSSNTLLLQYMLVDYAILASVVLSYSVSAGAIIDAAGQ